VPRMQSKAAHRRTVKVCQELNVPYKRPHSEHPSVLRALANFNRLCGRKEADIRRLPDIFRETPLPHGGTVPTWRHRTPDGHRCKSLGSVDVPSNSGARMAHEVRICKFHRATPPRTADYTNFCGADWLKEFYPDKFEQWIQASHRPQSVSWWQAQRQVIAPASPTFVRCVPSGRLP
jgi:hypothetical protein